MKYYIISCISPSNADLAMLTYESDDPLRSWADGERFDSPPPEPIIARVKKGYSGLMAEFWDDPVPLMTKRMLKVLKEIGVKNIDTYRAQILEGNKSNDTYEAFNLVGLVSGADMNKSNYDPVSMMLEGVQLDEQKLLGAPLMFRLKESVNAILVHESVKKYLEESGINTLTFTEPMEWMG